MLGGVALIDEPDLYINGSCQRQLMETLASLGSEKIRQLTVTSHSEALIEAYSEV